MAPSRSWLRGPRVVQSSCGLPTVAQRAVLEGLRRARGEILVCNVRGFEPSAGRGLPMVQAPGRADFVIGSRYVKGGSTSTTGVSCVGSTAAWPPCWRAPSRRRVTRWPASSPQAVDVRERRDFNPVGYKIGLELIVKCGCERVVEIPIHFEDRRFGTSKLTLKQQLLYLQHLRRLYISSTASGPSCCNFWSWAGSGTIVNLALLTILIAIGVPTAAAVAAAIWSPCASTSSSTPVQLSLALGRLGATVLRFMAASSMGALINYATTLFVLAHLTGARPQTAAVIGIAAGTSSISSPADILFFASHTFARRHTTNAEGGDSI